MFVTVFVANFFGFAVLCAAMPPKKTIKGEPKTPSSPQKGKSELTPKELSNMLVQLKNPKGETAEDKKAMYQHYMSLPRFSEGKKALAAMWKKDKSCKWFVEWKKKSETGINQVLTGRLGFGTKQSS